MGKRKEVILGQTKERLCEAGKECNYYRVCFDERDNPTDQCAISYCERYTDSDSFSAEKCSIAEDVQGVISNFKSYDGDDDYEYCDLGTMDDIIKNLQNLWYNLHDSRVISKGDKRCLEIALRLLELMQ